MPPPAPDTNDVRQQHEVVTSEVWRNPSQPCVPLIRLSRERNVPPHPSRDLELRRQPGTDPVCPVIGPASTAPDTMKSTTNLGCCERQDSREPRWVKKSQPNTYTRLTILLRRSPDRPALWLSVAFFHPHVLKSRQERWENDSRPAAVAS